MLWQYVSQEAQFLYLYKAPPGAQITYETEQWYFLFWNFIIQIPITIVYKFPHLKGIYLGYG